MPKLDSRPNLPKMEEAVQQFWNDTDAFKTSVEMRPKDKPYVFYDGPPFATGMPHYGHLLVSTIKDAVPRYWTMKGYRVERVWGWDCHGLPIENMIEQKLEIKGGKKGIEALGIAEFNDACRSEVLRLDKEWEKIINRLGRWVDFENNYKTMDTTFMESVWWGFQQLFNKGLVYQGRKVVMYCPRCATPLSNFEIAMDNSYKDVEDNSVYVKFKRKDAENEYFVAWTTTPWTLPGNVGLAVQADAEYSLVLIGKAKLWMAHTLVDKLARMQEIEKPELIKTVKGSELDDLEYEPLYDYMPTEGKKAHYVMTADFVSLEDGTGIVHTAAIYGEDDYALAQKKNLPCVPTLDDEGKFKSFVTPLAGMFYKKSEQWVIDDLTSRGLLYHSNKYTHSYPFCYRCNTPLYYNAVPAWFIDVQQIKNDLINHNESVNWYPEHLKHGRFGKGLETAPDWNVSRSRYWGTPMPIWEATQTSEVKSQRSSTQKPGTKDQGLKTPQRRVIGSIDELKKWAVDPKRVESVTDIHREFIDDIEVWVDDERTLKGKRIPEVFDCWVESGSMPFASKHYPFENKEAFEAAYPAQFVTEYIAQTRAWFYTMHVMSVGVFGKHSFENVLTTGNILGKDGSKMSKSKKNYPDPMLLINEYGVDSLRLYLMSSPVMKAENLNFDESDVSDIRKRVFIIWYNMVAFYMLYADENTSNVTSATLSTSKLQTLNIKDQGLRTNSNVMDKWLLSKLNTLIRDVTKYMDEYNLVKASRELMNFIDELSTWYLRRSRDRIRDSQESRAIFGQALVTVAQLFAPIAPFFSEWVYHTLVDENKSIHHTDWPTFDSNAIHSELEEKMAAVRSVVEKVHAARSEAGVRIRQPLASVTVTAQTAEPYQNLIEVLKDEVNVKKVIWNRQSGDLEAVLDTTLTPELIAEGEARELIRNIQKLRKTAAVDLNAVLTVTAPTWPPEWQAEIERRTKTKLNKGDELSIV